MKKADSRRQKAGTARRTKSSPRKRGSMLPSRIWIPAFAGMTTIAFAKMTTSQAVRCSLLSALCFLSPLPSAPVSIENNSIRVGFDSADGRLVELVEREGGRNLVRVRAVAGPRSAADDPGVWQLKLLGGDTITPARAHHFDVERLRGERALSLTWKNFDIEGSRDLAVTVTVRLEGDPFVGLFAAS